MMKNKIGLVCAMLLFIVAFTACSKATAVSTNNAITVKSVTLAQDLNENYQAINPKTQFLPTETIYVSVDVAGRPTMGSLNGRFYYGDQLISEATLDFSSVNQGIIVSIGEDTYAGFNLAPSEPWPVDNDYHFELFINGIKFGDYPYEVIQ